MTIGKVYRVKSKTKVQKTNDEKNSFRINTDNSGKFVHICYFTTAVG